MKGIFYEIRAEINSEIQAEMPTPLCITLPENSAGRDFVVSDIHGYFAALEAAFPDADNA